MSFVELSIYAVLILTSGYILYYETMHGDFGEMLKLPFMKFFEESMWFIMNVVVFSLSVSVFVRSIMFDVSTGMALPIMIASLYFLMLFTEADTDHHYKHKAH